MQSASLGLFWEEAEAAVLILDRHDCCIAMNQAACDLFGLPQAQLVNRSIADFIVPASRQLCQMPPEQRLIQFQIVRPDQTVRSIKGTMIPNSRLRLYLWMLDDVTLLDDRAVMLHSDPSDPEVVLPPLHNRQPLEQAFWQQELLNVFMHSAPIGMMVLDRQFRCVRLNPALAEMTRMAIEDHLGKTVWDFVPQIARQQTEIFEQVMATGKPVLNLEVTGDLLQHPGGNRTWLISYFPIQTPEPSGIGVIVRDVTDLKRTQSKLEQINADLEIQVQRQTAELQQSLRFEAILKRITDKMRDSLDEAQILQTAVYELTQALDILSCDTGLYDLEKGISIIAYESIRSDVPIAKGTIVPFSQYQENYDQLLSGQYLHICWLPDQEIPSIRFAAYRFTKLAVPIMDEQDVIGDMWLYRPQAQPFDPAEIRLVQQVASQCAIALRQSRLYQAAQKQVHELERLNRLKDDFLSTVSHELRTPMSNLKMAVQMLELYLTPLGVLNGDAQPIASYFKILSEECDREISLINDLLDLARLDAETELYQVGTIDLSFWLPHIAETFQPHLTSQQQQFVLAIEASLPSLSTDLFYLERIIVELLTNACKYTPAHETIHLAAQCIADQIQIQVMNTGVAIPPAERDRIFDKFYRIPNSDPWQHGGTGLGLALVQKMAHRLGATIAVESGCNRASMPPALESHAQPYTCFTLTFPLALADPPAPPGVCED